MTPAPTGPGQSQCDAHSRTCACMQHLSQPVEDPCCMWQLSRPSWSGCHVQCSPRPARAGIVSNRGPRPAGVGAASNTQPRPCALGWSSVRRMTCGSSLRSKSSTGNSMIGLHRLALAHGLYFLHPCYRQFGEAYGFVSNSLLQQML